MKLIAATTAALLLATPAFAADPRPAPSPAEPAAAAAPADTAPARAKRYCFVEAPTGTRIERKVCKTRAEWRAIGQDIPAGL